MKRFKAIGFMAVAAVLLLVSCKSVETKSETPAAPVVRNVKMMVPDAN